MQKKKTKKIQETKAPEQKTNYWNMAFKFFFNTDKGNIVFIFLLSFLLYGNTLPGEYVLDDGLVIVENNFTKQGIHGLDDIFMNDMFAGISGSSENKLYTGGRYRPLSYAVFAIVYEIFGLNTFIGHLLNIIFYAIIGCLLLFILKKLLLPLSQNMIWQHVPLIITIIYLSHPIHTEVVANIKSLDEILCMLLSLVVLYSSIQFSFSSNKKWLIISIIAFFLALLAKENAITFLALVPLTMFFFDLSWKKNMLPTLISLIIGLIAYFLLRYAAIGISTETVQSEELFHNPFMHATTSERYATILLTWLKYLKLLIFPHPLTHDYYPKQIPIVSWNSLSVIISLIVHVVIIIIGCIAFFKKKLVGWAIAHYFITFSVTSNLVFDLGLFMNERFMFMPSLGFAVFLGWCFYKITEWRQSFLPFAMFLLILILLAYGAKTITRNQAWLTGYGLFMTDVKTSTNSGRCNVIAGSLLLEKARKDSLNAPVFLKQSIDYLKKGLEIYDGNLQGWGVLGEAYIRTGQFADAKNAFLKVIEKKPADAIILHNLNFIVSKEIEQKKYTDALQTIAILRKQNPNYEDYLISEIDALNGLNMKDSAISLMLQHVNKNHHAKKIWNKLGEQYGKINGNMKEAIRCFEQAIKIDSTYLHALENIGIAYGFTGSFEKSIYYLEQAHRLSPDNLQIMRNLAISYQNGNRLDEAKKMLEKIKQAENANSNLSKTF